jgi:hypothetical protein
MNQERRKRIIWWVVLFAVGIVVLGSLRWFSSNRTALRLERVNEFARVSLVEEGVPRQVVLMIYDIENRPVENARIQVWNNSGFTFGYADSKGIVVLNMGESDLIAIHVDDVEVFKAGSEWPRLDVGSGLFGIVRLRKSNVPTTAKDGNR